jgi:hypothetical protein
VDKCTTLRRAFFNSANLSGVDLKMADLYLATLSEANLQKSNLSRADLSFADLNEANLQGANLSFANLHEANLRGADLRGAIVGATIFAHLDLRQVTGLVEITHQGSSRVELHTVQLPQDGTWEFSWDISPQSRVLLICVCVLSTR